MPVVTISAQFGAGARQVGRIIADRLALDYVDQAVLTEAARALGVAVSSVAARTIEIDPTVQAIEAVALFPVG